MNNILDSLKQSIENENWYGALLIALSLPDICSKIDEPKKYTRIRYPNWFDKYVVQKYTSIKIETPAFEQIEEEKELIESVQNWLEKAYPETGDLKKNKRKSYQALKSGDLESFNAISKIYNDLVNDSSPFRKKHIFLNRKDCYALRFAILHEGTGSITNQNVRDVLESFQFRKPKVLPNGSKVGITHNNIYSENILQLQIDIFCSDIFDSVKFWMNTIEKDDPRNELLTSRVKIY